MGTSVSLAYEKSDFGVPEHNLKKISEYKDKRFGQVTILREKIAPKRMFLRKTVPYTSDEDIRSIQKKYLFVKLFLISMLRLQVIM